MFEDLIKFIREWYATDEFIPLHAPFFSKLDREYVMDAIDSTFVSSIGEYVNRFELELAEYVGARRVVTTVNGTAALQVALRLVGVEAGTEVITQPLTFVATANAIVYNNAFPVFIDVDRDTMGLSPCALESFLHEFAEKRDEGVFNKTSGRRIASILPVHIFGHPCKIDRLVHLSDAWNIPIVEDAAEALGSIRNNKMCGTFGKLGIFSFNGNKTITCGCGGAIVTNDETLAEKAKHLTTTAKINHPWEYIHDEVGYNFRMPNLNAALACAQLRQLDGFLGEKRKLAASYGDFFKQKGVGNFVFEPKNCLSNYWLNTFITNSSHEKEMLLKETREAVVMTRPIWRLMAELPMYRKCQTDSLKSARYLRERAVNLPSSVRNSKLKGQS
jgi:aminotransferase in exopolysaccharide biosynthesis